MLNNLQRSSQKLSNMAKYHQAKSSFDKGVSHSITVIHRRKSLIPTNPSDLQKKKLFSRNRIIVKLEEKTLVTYDVSNFIKLSTVRLMYS